MSIALRVMVIASIVIVAVTVAPAALQPQLNTADFVEYAAPFAILAAGWWRPKSSRRGSVPQHDADAPDPASPPAGSRTH